MSIRLDEKDRALLHLLQDSLPVTGHPYRAISEMLGITQEEVLERMLRMKDEGLILRIGAILRHGRAGYAFNVLTAWTITPEAGETAEQAQDRVGEILAADSHISHCYARVVNEAFPYPMFAMVHARSELELEETLSDLRARLPVEDVRCLRTKREWKKTSMKYV